MAVSETYFLRFQETVHIIYQHAKGQKEKD